MKGFQFSLVFQSFLVFVSAFQHPQTAKRLPWRRMLMPSPTSPTPSEKTTALFAARVAVEAAKPGNLVLAGKLTRSLSMLVITPKKARGIISAVANYAHVGDLAMILALGWGTLPLARFIHGKKNPGEEESDFKRSKTFKWTSIISQVSQLGLIVYAADLSSVALKSLGITYPLRSNLSTTVAKITYAIWFAFRACGFKQKMLMRAVRAPSPEKLGKNQVYDRLFNILILCSTGLWILDLLSVETGRAIGSIFALGSVGTLIFSLASKDMATQFVSGLALSASGRFYDGEEIEIGDGTRGIVVKVGWMYSEIRGGDEIIVKIPNQQIANQRVKNISRMRWSQVKTDVWVRYQDIKKIPELIKDIREEIIESCPNLITDSRAFRVHWREFEKDHLTIAVDAHFNVPPTGTVYWDNRQEVLLAIMRAAERNNINFAIPTVEVKGGESITDAVKSSQIVSDSLNDSLIDETESGVNGASIA